MENFMRNKRFESLQKLRSRVWIQLNALKLPSNLLLIEGGAFSVTCYVCMYMVFSNMVS